MWKIRSLGIMASVTAVIILSTSCNRQASDEYAVLDQTYIHKYGVAVPQEFWSASGEDGAVVSTMANGVIVTRRYNGGVLNGSTTYSFPQISQIETEEVYRDGVLIKTVEYFVDGTPKEETVYDAVPGSSTQMKTVSSWYFGGTPRSVEQYQGELLFTGEYYTITNLQGSSVENCAGVRLTRDEHGLLLTREEIDHGLVINVTTFYPSGTPQEKIPYKNGMVTGVKQTFFPAGDPNTVEEWVQGCQQGLTTIYQHGEKSSEVPYINGTKNGIEKRYRDGVNLIQEISWKNDLRHGPCVTYVGDTNRTEWYYNGDLKSKVEYDFLTNRSMGRM